MRTIIDIIDRVLMAEESKERTHHYPSDGCSCARKLWYSWNKVPKSNPIEPAQLCKIHMGNAIHEKLAEILKKDENIVVESEVPFKVQIPGLKYELSGRMDNIISFKDTGEKVGIEVKSSFGRGIKEIQMAQKPKEEHLAQVAMYLKFNPDIKTFILLYIARDNAYRTEFWVQLTDNGVLINGKRYEYNLQKLFDNFKEAESDKCPSRKYKMIIKNGELREKMVQGGIEYVSDWQCRYCAYLGHCWADEITKGE